MMNLADTMISKRLRLIAALPTAVALLFAGSLLVQQVSVRNEAARMAAGTALSIQLGGLIHALQKERGLSAGFTSSNGTRFAEELPRQREQTDAQISALAKMSDTQGSLQAVQAGLGQLSGLRAAIDRRSLPVPALAARYTQVVNATLDAIEHLAAANASQAQAKAQAAYIELIRGKESAGLERAMGATGFGTGRFDPATFRSFVGFIAVQDSAFGRFRQLATDTQRDAFDRLLSSPSAQVIVQYREAAFRAAAAGYPLNQDAAIWWKATTARIEQLKVLEDSVAEGMIAVAEASMLRADMVLVGTILFLAVVAAALVLLVRRITRSILIPLAQIRTATDAIAQGELHGTVTLPDGRNELNDLGRSVDVLRTQLREAETAKAAQTRLIIDSVGAGLEALARGDLVHRVTTELSGPFAVLKANFNATGESLCALVGTTLRSAEAIRAGSSEISHAAADLARRTESNAATLEETSAALVEVDSRVRATATSSAETLRRADEAIGTLHQGRAITNRAVDSMSAVAVSAQDIDSVIEGLDKIAFQTRVLAMNAAVEAGRAGEAGRGFAVVADLVSALAMRAEEEAKRAREQLTVTQEGITTAVEVVRSVDGALDAIAQKVTAVHHLIGGIAEHNNAQSASLGQITNAVGEVDRATQQNAAMVEQTSAAAASLASEVEVLANHASRFEVGEVRNVAYSEGTRTSTIPGAPRWRSAHIAA